ncbi:U32 family peptidase [Methanopyrus kandleri]
MTRRRYLCCSRHHLDTVPEDSDGIVVPVTEHGVATLLPRYPETYEVEDIVDVAKDRGLSVQALMDFTCAGCEHLSLDGYPSLRSTLDYLASDLEVDGVVVADPYLVEVLATEYDLTVVVSHTAAVDTPEKAWHFERLGADVITVDPALNSNEEEVSAIRDRVSVELRAAVGAITFRDPVAFFERNLFSHATAEGIEVDLYRNNPYEPMRERVVVWEVREELFDEVFILASGEPP